LPLLSINPATIARSPRTMDRKEMSIQNLAV
jgi:hypothetical protein